MLKKTITYEDFNGEERTDDFYFALNEAELLKTNLKYPGGYEGMLRHMKDTRDTSAMVDILDEIILSSYGVKSADGIRFEKSKELSKAFMETNAYVKLVIELLSGDGTNMINFVQGIVPAKMSDQIKLEIAKREKEQKEHNLTVVDGTAEPVG